MASQTCSASVYVRVGWVVKLLQYECVWGLGCHLLGLLYGTTHTLGGVCVTHTHTHTHTHSRMHRGTKWASKRTEPGKERCLWSHRHARAHTHARTHTRAHTHIHTRAHTHTHRQREREHMTFCIGWGVDVTSWYTRASCAQIVEHTTRARTHTHTHVPVSSSSAPNARSSTRLSRDMDAGMVSMSL